MNEFAEATQAKQYTGRQGYADPNIANYGLIGGNTARIRAKGEEDRAALAFVLRAGDLDISIAALEKAITTLKTHVGE